MRHRPAAQPGEERGRGIIAPEERVSGFEKANVNQARITEINGGGGSIITPVA